MLFENSWVRFALSGTLISIYAIADHLARRHARSNDRAELTPTRWVSVAIVLSITAYYLLIGPTGGAIAGGAGNLAGIGLVLIAALTRWLVRNGTSRVRYPAVASRMLFYIALPLAVGVPLGWLALTLPACALSAWCTHREDARRLQTHGLQHRDRMATTARWVPGVW